VDCGLSIFHLLHHFIEKYGRDHPIDVGASNLKTPNIQTVTSIEPETLGDLEPVLDYVEADHYAPCHHPYRAGGRFKHLFSKEGGEEEIARIQAIADWNAEHFGME